MRDNLRSPNATALALYERTWSVGQQYVPFDERSVVHQLLPDTYKYSVINGRSYPAETTHFANGEVVERSLDDRERIKHVLIVAGSVDEEGQDDSFGGVVADLTGVYTPGKLLPYARSPGHDAALAEYICKLHNDALAARKA